MSIAWPRFFDPALRLPLREQWALHWSANLRMLRRPAACALFTAIALLPTLALVAASLVMGRVTGAPDWFVRSTWIVPALALLLAWLIAQHTAFVVAMDRTYGPFVRAELRHRGTPVCLRCGQLLDRADQTCPECGTAAP